MQQVSLPWLVLALGGSPLQLGAVAVLQFGPAFFLAPLGGVMADRVDKRRALVIAHASGVAQATVLFALTAAGAITIELILLMALWLGLINGVEMPVRHSFAPDLVPRRLLPNAIALQAMAFNSARVVGPAIAGAVIGIGTAAFGSAVAGVATSLALSVVAYAAVLVALLRMDPAEVRTHEPTTAAPPVLSSLGEGIAYARSRPIIAWPLLLMAGITAFGFNFQILLPLYSRDVLGLDAAAYGALFSGIGVGSVCGSLTLAFMRRRPALLLMIGGCVTFALGMIALGFSRSFAVALGIVFVLGYTWMLVVNTVNATIQANVTDALRGRVMALYVTVFVGGAPLGGIVSGALADTFGTPMTFAICASLALAVTAIVVLGLRHGARTEGLGVTRIDG
jgi:MFS family permease